MWRHPLIPEDEVTISGNDGDDAREYQVRNVRVALAKVRSAMEKNP